MSSPRPMDQEQGADPANAEGIPADPIVERPRAVEEQQEPAPQQFTDEDIAAHHMRFLKDPSSNCIHEPEFKERMLVLVNRAAEKLRTKAKDPNNNFDDELEVTKERNDLLMKFLEDGDGMPADEEEDKKIRQRLVALAYMDGPNTEFAELVRCLNAVLEFDSQKAKFSKKYSTFNVGHCTDFLSNDAGNYYESPEYIEQFTPMRAYLLSNSEEREAELPRPRDEPEVVGGVVNIQPGPALPAAGNPLGLDPEDVEEESGCNLLCCRRPNRTN